MSILYLESLAFRKHNLFFYRYWTLQVSLLGGKNNWRGRGWNNLVNDSLTVPQLVRLLAAGDLGIELLVLPVDLRQGAEEILHRGCQILLPPRMPAGAIDPEQDVGLY